MKESEKKEVIDLKKVVSPLIDYAEHFGAAGASIRFNYPDGWSAEVSVKKNNVEIEEEDEKAE